MLEALHSAMVEIYSKSAQLDLVLHTAVDYLHRRGAGIGVVQRAECTKTGAFQNDRIPGQERKYSYSRKDLVVKNIKTAARAQMLAMVHALGLAHRTVKRRCPKAVQLQKVTIFSDLPSAVQAVNHHMNYNANSLRDVVSTNDRSIIKRIVARVRKLSHRGLEVAIEVSSGTNRAGKRARTIARQNGRKAWKSRRRLQLVNMTPTEAEGTTRDHETSELVVRNPEVH